MYEPKYDIGDIHNNWVKNGEPICEDLLTEAWKKRIEEYELPDLTGGRKKIIEKLLPDEYRNAVLG